MTKNPRPELPEARFRGATRASGVGESRVCCSGAIGWSAGTLPSLTWRILGTAGLAIGVEPNGAR